MVAAAVLRDREDPLRDLARRAVTDPQAMGRLLEAVAPAVLRAACSVLGPERSGLEAEDATQEALLSLARALPAFRGDCSVTTFASRIAVRAASLVRHRAEAPQRRVAALVAAGPIAAPMSASPEDEAGRSRRTALFRELLHDLPEPQAEAIALRVVLGCSLDEVAAATGAPVNTVRSRLRLAREALRRQIEGDETLRELFEVDL